MKDHGIYDRMICILTAGALIIGASVVSVSGCVAGQAGISDMSADTYYSAEDTDLGPVAYSEIRFDYCINENDGMIYIPACGPDGFSNGDLTPVDTHKLTAGEDISVFSTVGSYTFDSYVFEAGGSTYVQKSYMDIGGHVVASDYLLDGSSLGEETDIFDGMEGFISGVYDAPSSDIIVTATSVYMTDSNRINIYVAGDGESSYEITFTDLTDELVCAVTNVAELSDNELLVSYWSEDSYSLKHRIIDTTDTSEPIMSEEMPQFLTEGDIVYNLSDGTVLISRTEGLYRLDGSQPVEILDYALSGFDMSRMKEMKLLHAEEDGSLVFLDTSPDQDYLFHAHLIKLTPREAETRDIVRVGVLDYIPGTFARQVAEFNDTNDTYFARVELIASVDTDAVGYLSNADYGTDDYGSYLSLLCSTNDAVEDYLRNDPPDVFVTDGMQGALRGQDLFIDLNEWIDSDPSLDRSDYFENVLDAASESGRMSFMPVTFYISGIHEMTVTGSDSAGISYQDYRDTVSEYYDGLDPVSIYCDRLEYAEELMSSQYDLFVNRQDGTAVFHNAAFYALIDHIDTIGEDEDTDTADGVFYLFDMPAEYGSLYYADQSYIYDCSLDGRWYGLPSYDERGLSAAAVTSVGIPVNASDPDGARGFVRYLLSSEGQRIEPEEGGLPVRRDALSYMLRDDINAREYVFDTIENVDSFYVTDVELRYICHMAIGQYLNGECNADEAADIIEEYMEGHI